MKFRGHSHRSLDEKGRLIFPPDFRDRICEASPDGRVVLTLFEGHVIGMTPEQWEETEQELDKIKNPSRALKNLIRVLYAGYEEVALNKQGRIQLPAHLRKSGKLYKDVVLMGVGKRFEIWGAEQFEDLLEDTQDDVADELSENGVDFPF